jgi:hypothetical protein
VSTTPKNGRIYSWLHRHRWLITLVIAAASVIATVLAAFITRAPAPIGNEAPTEHEQQVATTRIAELHALIVEQNPNLTAFMFAEYDQSTPLHGHIVTYQATRTRYLEAGREGCYSDYLAKIVTDFEQGYLLTACSAPYYTVPEEAKGGELASAWMVVRLFGSPRMFSAALSCACSWIEITNPVYDVEARALDVTIFGAPNTTVFGPHGSIVLRMVDDGTRVRIQFDEQGEPLSMRRVRH